MTDPTKTASQQAPAPLVKPSRITYEDCCIAALQGAAANPGIVFKGLEQTHKHAVELAEKMWEHIQAKRRVASAA